jgi:hypothetical protein
LKQLLLLSSNGGSQLWSLLLDRSLQQQLLLSSYGGSQLWWSLLLDKQLVLAGSGKLLLLLLLARRCLLLVVLLPARSGQQLWLWSSTIGHLLLLLEAGSGHAVRLLMAGNDRRRLSPASTRKLLPVDI